MGVRSLPCQQCRLPILMDPSSNPMQSWHPLHYSRQRKTDLGGGGMQLILIHGTSTNVNDSLTVSIAQQHAIFMDRIANTNALHDGAY
jgi:hypothetical protein